MVLNFGFLAKIVVEAAFLYRDLEEEIYMECSQGMSSVQTDECIILSKCIYCLVQAKLQYYKMAIKILKNLQFIGGNVNPCLCVKKRSKGIVCIALYIHDNLMIGDMMVIDDANAALKVKGWCSKLWKSCGTTCPAK